MNKKKERRERRDEERKEGREGRLEGGRRTEKEGKRKSGCKLGESQPYIAKRKFNHRWRFQLPLVTVWRESLTGGNLTLSKKGLVYECS